NQKIGDFATDDKTYILAWTTTLWTLPGNVGLAVNEDIDYVVVRKMREVMRDYTSRKDGYKEEYYIFSKSFFEDEKMGFIPDAVKKEDGQVRYFLGHLYRIERKIKGIDLTMEISYQPLFDISEFKKSETAYKIYPADFVSATEGTGVVHTAVMYGEDDYQLGKKVGLPTFHTVTEDGKFKKDIGLGDLEGRDVKAEETTKKILEILGDKVFHQEPYKHDYPHCWRCSTALLYYARKAWWVRTTAVKKELLANNEKINWVPLHLKHGRFGEFLRDVRDWCFSRERYWGTPLPIWKCEKCGEIEVIGSVEELKKRAGALPRDENKEINLHRPFVDEIAFTCAKKDCGGAMRRTPEVADVWFDSGAMPFAQNHYPFSSYEARPHKIVASALRPRNDELAYPADYICEAVDQTRGWFYSMLAIATLLGRSAPYKNVISLGHVLDAKGEKMSKSKGNIVSHDEMIGKYGVDALRWYFFTVNSPGDPKRFEEKDVALRARGFVATLWNSFVFFDTYVKKPTTYNLQPTTSQNVLDQWILAKLNMLVGHVTAGLNEYDLVGAARVIDQFTVNDFSQW
ncbi:MAG: class I tRNA ligase family protein, partial [Candidatus Sungiibacteriota bacterium]